MATFSFTMTGANLSGNVNNVFFAGIKNQWWEDITADTQIFTSISGTGLAGALTRSTATPGDPFTYIQTIPNTLTFTDGAESSGTANIGLTVGGTSVNYVIASNLDWGATLPMAGGRRGR